MEELAKMTSATLPVTLEAMEESAREVETLAAETPGLAEDARRAPT